MQQTSFAELIQSDRPTLVDFSAEWCGPCKMMRPILDDLKSEVGDSAKIITVDIEENPNAAAAYQIQSIPTLMLFKSGKIVWRQAGVLPTENLRQIIDQNI